MWCIGLNFKSEQNKSSGKIRIQFSLYISTMNGNHFKTRYKSPYGQSFWQYFCIATLVGIYTFCFAYIGKIFDISHFRFLFNIQPARKIFHFMWFLLFSKFKKNPIVYKQRFLELSLPVYFAYFTCHDGN